MLGITIWTGVALVVAWLVATSAESRSVLPLYRDAAANWHARQPLYAGPLGMNYLPPFALLFLPFEALGFPAGDILWRLFAASMLAWGLWRICSRLAPDRAPERFLCVSVLSLLMFLSPLRYGQANAHLGGAMVCAVAMLLERRWWPAASFLALCVWIKPLGLVLLLLAPLAYPAVALPGAVMLAAVFALPFAMAPADYVGAQYSAAIANLQSCSEVTENRFANVQGLVRALGGDITPTFMRGIMLGAAAAAALLAWFHIRRMAEPRRAVGVLIAAATFLMLFNPMNEGNSFGIFAPAVALMVAILVDVDGRTTLGRICAALLALAAILPEALRFATPALHLWLSPLMALAMGSLAAWLILSRWPRAAEVQGG